MDTFESNETPRDALRAAAFSGQEREVRALLAAGVSPNGGADLECLPLHAAAQEGHTGCLRALLEAGAETCMVEPQLLATPLHLAAREGHEACVRALVAAGPASLLRVETNSGHRAVDLAKASGHAGCVRILREAAVAAPPRVQHQPRQPSQQTQPLQQQPQQQPEPQRQQPQQQQPQQQQQSPQQQQLPQRRHHPPPPQQQWQQPQRQPQQQQPLQQQQPQQQLQLPPRRHSPPPPQPLPPPKEPLPRAQQQQQKQAGAQAGEAVPVPGTLPQALVQVQQWQRQQQQQQQQQHAVVQAVAQADQKGAPVHTWESQCRALAAFVAANKRLPMAGLREGQQANLGAWLSSCRVKYEQGQLDEQQQRDLQEAVGPALEAVVLKPVRRTLHSTLMNDATLMIDALATFAAANNRLPTEEEAWEHEGQQVDLGAWLHNRRKEYIRGKLDGQHQRDIEAAVGPALAAGLWGDNKQQRDSFACAALASFVAANGRLPLRHHVWEHEGQQVNLGNWLHYWRGKQRQGALDEQQQRALQAAVGPAHEAGLWGSYKQPWRRPVNASTMKRILTLKPQYLQSRFGWDPSLGQPRMSFTLEPGDQPLADEDGCTVMECNKEGRDGFPFKTRWVGLLLEALGAGLGDTLVLQHTDNDAAGVIHIVVSLERKPADAGTAAAAAAGASVAVQQQAQQQAQPSPPAVRQLSPLPQQLPSQQVQQVAQQQQEPQASLQQQMPLLQPLPPQPQQPQVQQVQQVALLRPLVPQRQPQPHQPQSQQLSQQEQPQQEQEPQRLVQQEQQPEQQQLSQQQPHQEQLSQPQQQQPQSRQQRQPAVQASEASWTSSDISNCSAGCRHDFPPLPPGSARPAGEAPGEEVEQQREAKRQRLSPGEAAPAAPGVLAGAGGTPGAGEKGVEACPGCGRLFKYKGALRKHIKEKCKLARALEQVTHEEPQMLTRQACSQEGVPAPLGSSQNLDALCTAAEREMEATWREEQLQSQAEAASQPESMAVGDGGAAAAAWAGAGPAAQAAEAMEVEAGAGVPAEPAAAAAAPPAAAVKAESQHAGLLSGLAAGGAGASEPPTFLTTPPVGDSPAKQEQQHSDSPGGTLHPQPAEPVQQQQQPAGSMPSQPMAWQPSTAQQGQSQVSGGSAVTAAGGLTTVATVSTLRTRLKLTPLDHALVEAYLLEWEDMAPSAQAEEWRAIRTYLKRAQLADLANHLRSWVE